MIARIFQILTIQILMILSLLFSWFELFRNIRDEHWADADLRCNKLKGFVPALFQKQDIFWEQKITL